MNQIAYLCKIILFTFPFILLTNVAFCQSSNQDSDTKVIDKKEVKDTKKKPRGKKFEGHKKNARPSVKQDYLGNKMRTDYEYSRQQVVEKIRKFENKKESYTNLIKQIQDQLKDPQNVSQLGQDKLTQKMESLQLAEMKLKDLSSSIMEAKKRVDSHDQMTSFLKKN